MMLVAAAAQEWGVDAGASARRERQPDRPRRQAHELRHGRAQGRPAGSCRRTCRSSPSAPSRWWATSSRSGWTRPARSRASRCFGIDTRVPGMLYAAVAMSPYIGGKVKSYDDSRAKNMPGVKSVVQYSRGVAVVADSYWQAKKAKDLLRDRLGPGRECRPEHAEDLGGLARSRRSSPVRCSARTATSIRRCAGAAKTVTATYQLPFLSHSPMEPQNTTAHVMADKAVIITPTQFQQLIPHVVAGATGLKPEQVEVHDDLSGRRLRPSRRSGLRHRCRGDLQGGRRRAGEDGVEPRRRHDARLLSSGRSVHADRGHGLRAARSSAFASTPPARRSRRVCSRASSRTASTRSRWKASTTSRTRCPILKFTY